jgi:hypothetical protein
MYKKKAGCQWLTSVIPTTQETEDQEDRGLKPAQANQSKRPYLENIHHEKKKRAGEGPFSNPGTAKTKNKTTTTKKHLQLRTNSVFSPTIKRMFTLTTVIQQNAEVLAHEIRQEKEITSKV